MHTGSPLLLSFGFGVVLTNWIKFIFFIGVPVIAFVSLLFSGSQGVIEHTMVTCFISVSVFFFCFAVVVIFFRLSACLYLVQELCEKDEMTVFERFKRLLLTAEESAMSGKLHNIYIYFSNVYDLKRFDSTGGSGNDDTQYKYSTHGQWYTNLTQQMPRLFVTLDVPRRCWQQAEIDQNVPIYTKNSWSLEMVFCRKKNESHIAMLSGESALTQKQTGSSLVCYIFGVLFYIVVLTALMVFFQAPSAFIATVVVLFVAYWVWQAYKELRLIKHFNKLLQSIQSEVPSNQSEEVESHDRALFQKTETFAITKPTSTFAWVYFIFKNVFYAITPFAYFCYSRNLVGAITYVFMYGLCFEKTYFDIAPIVESLGSYGTLGMESGAKLSHDGLLGASTKAEWEQKSRLYHITRMNNTTSRKIWA